MASPDESWNAAAICQALGCPGCPDCRDDDSDATWDCTTPRDEPGDCPVHEIPLIEVGADGYEVT